MPTWERFNPKVQIQLRWSANSYFDCVDYHFLPNRERCHFLLLVSTWFCKCWEAIINQVINFKILGDFHFLLLMHRHFVFFKSPFQYFFCSHPKDWTFDLDWKFSFDKYISYFAGYNRYDRTQKVFQGFS